MLHVSGAEGYATKLLELKINENPLGDTNQVLKVTAVGKEKIEVTLTQNHSIGTMWDGL